MRFMILPVTMSLFLAAACSSDPSRPLTQPADSAEVLEMVDWNNAPIVTVTLSDHDFTPDEIALKARQPYRLRLVNKGSGGHDFTAPDFFSAAAIAASDQSLAPEGKVALAKGDSREIRLVPLVPGEYRVVCTHFMHAAMGMKARVTVVDQAKAR